MKRIVIAALAALVSATAPAQSTPTSTATWTQTPTKTPNLCQVPNCDATPGTPCATPVEAHYNRPAAQGMGPKQVHLKPVGTPGAVKMQWGCRPNEAGEIVWYQPTPGVVPLIDQTTLSCHTVYCRIQECSSGSCRMDGYAVGLGVD